MLMTTPEFWSGQDRVLAVEDMENMPDDELRYELDDGVLIVSLAPSTLHQLAVTRLAVILSAACPAELVVLAGLGVNINKFQPGPGRRALAERTRQLWPRQNWIQKPGRPSRSGAIMAKSNRRRKQDRAKAATKHAEVRRELQPAPQRGLGPLQVGPDAVCDHVGPTRTPA